MHLAYLRQSLKDIGQLLVAVLIPGPSDDVPLTTNDSAPSFNIVRIVRHHVMLTAMFTEPIDNPICNRAAVDRNANMLVGNSAHVVHGSGVKRGQVHVGALTVPSSEDRLRYCAMQ